MAGILTNLRYTVVWGFVLSALLFFLYFAHGYDGWTFAAFFSLRRR